MKIEKKSLLLGCICLSLVFSFSGCNSNETDKDLEKELGLHDARESLDIVKIPYDSLIKLQNTLTKTATFIAMMNDAPIIEVTRNNTILHITEAFDRETKKMAISNQETSPIILINQLNKELEFTILSDKKEKIRITRFHSSGVKVYDKQYADDRSYTISKHNINTKQSEVKQFDNQENILELIQKNSNGITVFHLLYEDNRSYSETDYNPTTGSKEITRYDPYKNIISINQFNKDDTLIYSKEFDDNRFYDEMYYDLSTKRRKTYRYNNLDKILSLVESDNKDRVIFSQYYNEDRSYTITQFNPRTNITNVTKYNRQGQETEKTTRNINNTVIFRRYYNSNRSGYKMTYTPKTGVRNETEFNSKGQTTIFSKTNKNGVVTFEQRYNPDRSYSQTEFNPNTKETIQSQYNSNNKLMSTKTLRANSKESYAKEYTENRGSYNETKNYDNGLKTVVTRRVDDVLISAMITLPNGNSLYCKNHANGDSEFAIKSNTNDPISISLLNNPIIIDAILSDQNTVMNIRSKRNRESLVELKFEDELAQFNINTRKLRQLFKTDRTGRSIFNRIYLEDGSSQSTTYIPDTGNETEKNKIKSYKEIDNSEFTTLVKEYDSTRAYTIKEFDKNGHITFTRYTPKETVIDTTITLPNKIRFFIQSNPDKTAKVDVTFPFDNPIGFNYTNTILEIKKRLINESKKMLVINTVDKKEIINVSIEENGSYHIRNYDLDKQTVRFTETQKDGKVTRFENFF